MAKQMGKYYLAIVPSGDIQEKATQLKYEVRERFNAKYALKSPAHVTLKMPFRWNESKEDKLKMKLSQFFKEQQPFQLVFKGIGRFGRRVIYIRVEQQPLLLELQDRLSQFCKRELKLIQEFSDTSYHPHMTLTHKDLKDSLFDDCLAYLKEKGFYEGVEVGEIALLKRGEKKWAVIAYFQLGKEEGAEVN